MKVIEINHNFHCFLDLKFRSIKVRSKNYLDYGFELSFSIDSIGLNQFHPIELIERNGKLFVKTVFL